MWIVKLFYWKICTVYTSKNGTPKFASNFDPAVYTSAIGLEILLTEIPIFDLLDNNTSLKDFDNVIKDTLNELVVIQ